MDEVAGGLAASRADANGELPCEKILESPCFKGSHKQTSSKSPIDPETSRVDGTGTNGKTADGACALELDAIGKLE